MSKLTKDSVFSALLKMAVPMLAGTFALNAYNLTDTWFVSRLGTEALAAMSFTFPVVMLLGFVMRGLGTGAMTIIARALGAGRHKTASRITTHAIFLASIIAVIFTAIGIVSVKPVFLKLGASGSILVMTQQYMNIWYLGLVVRVLQSMFGDIIIGTGNSKAASSLMVAGTVINFALDPVMIFGFFGFPRMGIQGAALATVLSEAAVLVGAFYVLHKKHRLVTFFYHSPKRILASWRRILYISVPSAISSVLTPISSAVVLKIVSSFGPAAVAACGVASRIELFAFMVPMTVGMSLVPFVAQNYGAGRFDRIKTARKGTIIFALIFGLTISFAFLVIIRPVAAFFSKDAEVINVLVKYIYITCFGYGFLETHRYCGFYMIGIHKPVSSAMLNIVRVIVLLVPLSFIGAKTFGLSGIFFGRLSADLISGVVGILWTGKVLNSKVRRAEAS